MSENHLTEALDSWGNRLYSQSTLHRAGRQARDARGAPERWRRRPGGVAGPQSQGLRVVASQRKGAQNHIKAPEPQRGPFLCAGEPLVPPRAPSFREVDRALALNMPAAVALGECSLSSWASRPAKPASGGGSMRPDLRPELRGTLGLAQTDHGRAAEPRHCGREAAAKSEVGASLCSRPDVRRDRPAGSLPSCRNRA